MWLLPVQRGVTAGAQDEDRTGVGCGAGTQGAGAGLGEPMAPPRCCRLPPARGAARPRPLTTFLFCFFSSFLSLPHGSLPIVLTYLL